MGGREEVRRFFCVGVVWRRRARVCARAGRGWARVLEVRRQGWRASAPSEAEASRARGGWEKGRPASKGRDGDEVVANEAVSLWMMVKK